MKAAGIVSEFNPFHNGHKYLIDEVKKAGYTHVVSVMSSYCVQRGDIAVFDPIARANAAVENGVDLVLELSTQYALAPAKDFAKAAVGILQSLGCIDTVAFGSETGDIEPIKKAAEAVEKLDKEEVKKLISGGLTYPQAVCALLTQHKSVLSGANNTLGLEYLLATSGKLNAFTVKRTAEHDGNGAENGYASASAIRKMLFNHESADALMPSCKTDVFCLKNAEKAVLYKLCNMTKGDFCKLPYGFGGISERLFKACRECESLDEICESVKVKSLTLSSVRRAVLCAALGIELSDIFPVPYARVLAFNQNGAEILKLAKKNGSIAVSTSLAELSKISADALRTAQITEAASRLQWLSGNAKYRSPYSAKIAMK